MCILQFSVAVHYLTMVPSLTGVVYKSSQILACLLMFVLHSLNPALLLWLFLKLISISQHWKIVAQKANGKTTSNQK